MVHDAIARVIEARGFNAATDLFGGMGAAIGIIGLWFIFDIIIVLFNLTSRSGCGGCSDENLDGGWVPFWGPLNWVLRTPCDQPESITDGTCPNSLGRWSSYAGSTNDKTSGKEQKNQFLCADEVTKVWKDAVERNIVSGYNAIQLVAYVIVPTITVMGILYGLLSTSMDKAEWTFWIMIATIMITGVTSIAYDTDISTIPSQENPLKYVTSKLNLGVADELEYSFISRKQNGDECLIKGTVLGVDAVHPENQPASYSGECSEGDVPL